MKREEANAFYRKITCRASHVEIDMLLDNLPADDLYTLADGLLHNWFLYDYALVSILKRLFSDTLEYARLLCRFLKATSYGAGTEELHRPLRERMIIEHGKSLSIARLMLELGWDCAAASGTVLSYIAQSSIEAKNFMIRGLTSTKAPLQRCGLLALTALLHTLSAKEDDEYLNLLKDVAPFILSENMDLLIEDLQFAFEKNPRGFDSVLEGEVSRRGVRGFREYVFLAHYREKASIPLLERSLDILESEDQEDPVCNLGLARIYETKPEFVIQKLESRLTRHHWRVFLDQDFLGRIRGSGIGPFLEMIERKIDQNNQIIISCSPDIMRFMFPSPSDWMSWCGKWNEDPRKRKVVLESLAEILSNRARFELSDVMNRATLLAGSIAHREGIDYEAETRKINLSDREKETVSKALYVLRMMLHPPVRIDTETLISNLGRAPYLTKAIGKDLLIAGAETRNPHPLAYIFHQGSPTENALLAEQAYWERVFKVLDHNNITIRKSKLRDPDPINVWSALAEAEVLSRLVSHFTVRTEPQIKELEPKRLDALIDYGRESALIEILWLEESLELSVAQKESAIPGKRIREKLFDKFEKQLKGGKSDPRVPIIMILGLHPPITAYEVEDAIYGTPTFSLRVDDDTGLLTELGSSRKTDGFLETQKTDIVTMIGVYRRDCHKKDSLLGRLYNRPTDPRNKLSQEFRLRLRTSIFGFSEDSDWQSLMRVPGIDEQKARALYSGGIDDIGTLATAKENEFEIVGIPSRELLLHKIEAIRVIHAMSTSSVRFLNGVDEQTLATLYNRRIYLIKDVLKLERSPEGIHPATWLKIREDAKRVLGSGSDPIETT